MTYKSCTETFSLLLESPPPRGGVTLDLVFTSGPQNEGKYTKNYLGWREFPLEWDLRPLRIEASSRPARGNAGHRGTARSLRERFRNRKTSERETQWSERSRAESASFSP